MLRRLILASSAGAAGVLLAACSLFFDTDKLGDAPAPANVDDASDEAASDAGGAIGEGSAPPASEAGAGCPSGRGPSMVRIDDTCIDSAEVTGAQYALFVAAMPDAGGPSDLAQCTGNDSWGPVMSMGFPPPPPEKPEFPVHGVDWCDAKAYCRWAGKDLCGSVLGPKTTLSSADATDPAKSFWEKACTKNGTKRFAYSDSYMSGRCVDGEKSLSVKNVTCEGGYDGIFDLVGNVAEWIDACEAPLDSQAPCALMGRRPGTDEIAGCTTVDVVTGSIPWGNAGIRCCAPAAK